MLGRPARLVLPLLAPAVAAAADAPAGTPATPATVADVVARAAPGSTIVLAAGSYDPIMIKDRQWSPAVTIEAGAAQIRSVRLDAVSGLTWHGGEFDGGDVERGGFAVQKSDHVAIDGAHFRHYRRNGIGLGSASDVRITNNAFSDMGSDGINVALSRRVVVDHNRCSDFYPTPKAHPDCVQLWSRPSEAPTADVAITNNEAIGNMQGFTAFNHARPDASGTKVDDGGFDRITVEHNLARVTTYHGVTISACRQCVVRHNRVETLPNPTNPRVHAWVKASGDGLVFCDNHAAGSNDAGGGRCRDGS